MQLSAKAVTGRTPYLCLQTRPMCCPSIGRKGVMCQAGAEELLEPQAQRGPPVHSPTSLRTSLPHPLNSFRQQIAPSPFYR